MLNMLKGDSIFEEIGGDLVRNKPDEIDITSKIAKFKGIYGNTGQFSCE